MNAPPQLGPSSLNDLVNDLEASNQNQSRNPRRNRLAAVAERGNASSGLLDNANMSEGTSCDMMLGCLMGWFFGILGICCLFNRRYQNKKFRNGLYIGILVKLIIAINMNNQEIQNNQANYQSHQQQHHTDTSSKIH